MMDRIAEVMDRIDCPHCGEETFACFDALVGSGALPKTAVCCEKCEKYFTVTASINVSCEDEAAQQREEE